MRYVRGVHDEMTIENMHIVSLLFIHIKLFYYCSYVSCGEATITIFQKRLLIINYHSLAQKRDYHDIREIRNIRHRQSIPNGGRQEDFCENLSTNQTAGCVCAAFLFPFCDSFVPL